MRIRTMPFIVWGDNPVGRSMSVSHVAIGFVMKDSSIGDVRYMLVGSNNQLWGMLSNAFL